MIFILVAVALFATTVINIIVPLPGSNVVTPLLALLVDPHVAIGLASFYFFLSGVVRVAVFWKHLRWGEIRKLLVPSIVAAFVGASALVIVPEGILLGIVFAMTVIFFMKKIGVIAENKKKQTPFVDSLVGLISGFLQGTGLAGSDVRGSYLYSRNLSIAEVQATSPFIGAANFLVATFARLSTHQLSLPDLAPLLFVFPFLVLGTLLGKKILYKIPKKTADMIIIVIMALIVVLLGVKLWKLMA